ncbi:MAG: tol-pal system protein YbgF [Alphaproteobacteria bacterium]|nr:tol-pal system protein YbgF [Alphaproteobacteria bacterium]
MDRLCMSGGVSVTAGVIGVILFGVCVCGFVATPLRSVYAQVNRAAETEIRFQQLEKEIRRLTGQVEEQQYDIRQLRDQVFKLLETVSAKKVQAFAPASGDSAADNLDHNVGGIAQSQGYNQDIYAKPLNENGGVSVVQDGSSQPPAFEDETVKTLGTYTKPAGDQDMTAGSADNNSNMVLASTGSAAGDYDRAYSYIKARDFDNAEQAFSAFIKAYPDDDLVSNAKYWYGETFYVRGDYDRAARIFAEGYQKYPKGSKAASNLLKLGMSLVGMGKPDDACIAFKQLKKDYANSAIPVLKRADTERAKIGCD